MEHVLGYELHRLLWFIDHKANDRLRPHGLTYTQFRILRSIDALSPVTGKDLAAFLLVTPSSMSKSVTRLIDQGFVVDTQLRGVGNIQRLELTRKGKSLLDPIAEELDAVLNHITASSGVDPETLASALRHMTEEFSKISGSITHPAAP
ncbi:MAG: winged helix-turn-helix transcriptional regulator [Tessaracoccus sp.]|uniref:MarR family winged helix-turn-helix transcriptional regulator n=1 Tax=Tessaracoccus sp. TaxID=1971211 RepID=UPI001EC57E57|nr:MarR family winged helix-turn-helix transcriptional regulator [Tessaracoccus sp.]MBK7819682.1 winged helix-turn-helix transcriptional regulator [Tessaracoccus sp.]